MDWEGHPATGVFAEGRGAFLVARQGLMVTGVD